MEKICDVQKNDKKLEPFFQKKIQQQAAYFFSFLLCFLPKLIFLLNCFSLMYNNKIIVDFFSVLKKIIDDWKRMNFLRKYDDASLQYTRNYVIHTHFCFEIQIFS